LLNSLCGDFRSGKILLECKETKYWGEKLIHDRWLSMNKEVAYRKTIKVTNKTHTELRKIFRHS
jgi:hypothetical protein